MKTDEQQKQGIDLYRQVKGLLVMKGDNLTAWCKRNDTEIQNIRHAFYGSWDGPKAKRLIKAVLKEVELETEDAA